MILIVQNDPDVPPGLLTEVLADAGVSFSVVAAWGEPQLSLPPEVKGLVVLGGAMGVHETERHPFLLSVMELMREALRREIPLLGICLGGQLLAAVCGGTVTPASGCGERGTMPVFLSAEAAADPLFSDLPVETVTFQWHDDSFDLPPSAVLLASSSACPVQAFRIGNAWGLQFHPEVTEDIIRCWSAEEPSSAAATLIQTYIQEHCVYTAVASRLFSRFARLASGSH